MSVKGKFSERFSGLGSNVFIKNTNLEKLLRKNNLLLENIFASNFKEFERLWYPIKLHLTATASTTTLTKIYDKQIEFPYSYYIHSLTFYSQTNEKSGFGLEINGQMYPAESYTITATTLTAGKLWYNALVDMKTIPFKKFIDKPFNLMCYAMNTHTSDQLIYLTINGYRVNLEQILKMVKKNNVRFE